jgi:hypothetical protein
MNTKEKLPISVITNTRSHISGALVFVNNYDKQYYLGVWNAPKKPIDIKPVSKEFRVSTDFVFRPDLIAYAVYGTPVLAWAVCYFNDILDPFDEETGLYAGRILNIVDLSAIGS